MLPQSEYESPMLASAAAPVAIAAITQDRALIGLLRSVIDPTNDLILVTSEAELTPHLSSRRVSVALLDSMFIEGDLAAMAERLRNTWPDLVLVVVGTAEEQSKVAGQITSGVVYRFLHRPVSAPRVRLFVDAALRRHEVENVERTLEQTRPDFSRLEKAAKPKSGGPSPVRAVLPGLIGAAVLVVGAVFWFARSPGDRPETTPAAAVPVVSPRSESTPEPARVASIPEPTKAELPPPTPEPAPMAAAPVVAAEENVRDRLRPAASQPVAAQSASPQPASPPPAVMQAPEEIASRTPPPALTFQERLDEQLKQAESALQRGELASPPGSNAVELFRGALALDPGNALAKGGLVRVADRLLTAAERALTAGSIDDARRMVAVAETLTPATARGAFLMMQIERERERAALTRAKDDNVQDKLEKGATYVRLAKARLRTGALIEPSADNARFYLEAEDQLIPEDSMLSETKRELQKALLDRAASAASAGNGAETERWLANADSAGAARPDMTNIRRLLHDTQNGARAGRMTALTQSFTNALGAKRLLQPVTDSAKNHLLAMIETDAGQPAVATARQSLGNAYLAEFDAALERGDLNAAGTWLNEARTIGFSGNDFSTAEGNLSARREQRAAAVGEKSLERTEYVAPKFPVAARDRGLFGWVELEFTVLADGSTGDVAVTNSSPRRTFDASAVTAVSQWRYKPLMRDGKPVESRVAVRIRFTDE